MANPLDTDAGSELFSNYEAELKLVQADLNQKLDQIPELTGEERKSAIRGAERAVDEAKELVRSLPTPTATNTPVHGNSATNNPPSPSRSWTK
jgi:vesicle transport through interaction with t-SNAREs protein 1